MCICVYVSTYIICYNIILYNLLNIRIILIECIIIIIIILCRIKIMEKQLIILFIYYFFNRIASNIIRILCGSGIPRRFEQNEKKINFGRLSRILIIIVNTRWNLFKNTFTQRTPLPFKVTFVFLLIMEFKDHNVLSKYDNIMIFDLLVRDGRHNVPL